MMRHLLLLLCFCAAATCHPSDSESSSGISVPVTLSGTLLHTNGAWTDGWLDSTTIPAFRGVISPTLRLGPHLFFYSAVAVQSASYFTGTSYNYSEHPDPVSAELMQAFVGYSGKVKDVSWLFKAGQLSSAFGLAPLEYDDFKMPLFMPPPSYTSALSLRPDQLPCGTGDLIRQQTGGEIQFLCGGSQEESYGLTPVTLYGLPGVEAQISAGRIDGRLQVTNSSPVNPQGLRSGSQFVQWTAGGGYSFGAGVHVGVSGFRGPYLNRTVEPLLGSADNLRALHASGLGLDVQWSRASWSVEGEWQRFQFDLPGFVVSPTVQAAYGQAKRIVSPRIFLAARLSFEEFGSVQDASGVRTRHFQALRKAVELGMGYRLNRLQLIKAGFGLSDFTSASMLYRNGLQNTVQLQLITDITVVSKAFQ